MLALTFPTGPTTICITLVIHSAVVVMQRSRTASCGATKVNFGWKLGPFIMAPVNHSPARNQKTTTALVIHIMMAAGTIYYKL